jgi:hypothetical protein
MLWQNSDNSRLIRLFFQPVRLGLMVSGAFKAWRNNKTKTNMNDAQLKLSSQICFPLYSASRLITKAYTHFENGDYVSTIFSTTGIVGKRWTLCKSNTEKLLLSTNTLSPLLKRMEMESLQRTRSIEDERSVIVQLTEKGEDLKERKTHS